MVLRATFLCEEDPMKAAEAMVKAGCAVALLSWYETGFRAGCTCYCACSGAASL